MAPGTEKAQGVSSTELLQPRSLLPRPSLVLGAHSGFTGLLVGQSTVDFISRLYDRVNKENGSFNSIVGS